MNDLSDFSDLELVRLMFYKLWNLYDAGGVNAGRSQRADLLDAIVNIWKLERRKDDTDLHEITTEMRLRLPIYLNQLEFNFGLELMDLYIFSCYCVYHICECYKRDQNLPERERQFINDLYSFMNVEAHLMPEIEHSPSDLIDASYQRQLRLPEQVQVL